jgi:hypothetical protein
MIRQPQWLQAGASALIAHSKASNVCSTPSMMTMNDLS